MSLRAEIAGAMEIEVDEVGEHVELARSVLNQYADLLEDSGDKELKPKIEKLRAAASVLPTEEELGEEEEEEESEGGDDKEEKTDG
jgi:hypothetical protein